jgi:hypothetical protein
VAAEADPGAAAQAAGETVDCCISHRKEHPTLAEDCMNEAMALYMSRLEMPTQEECDELLILAVE